MTMFVTKKNVNLTKIFMKSAFSEKTFLVE